MFVFETGNLFPCYIINFPTKRHWRGKARIEDIEAGLSALVEEIRRCGIRSVALPPLGCGLGGLEWSEVRARIEETLAGLADVRILVFEPTEVQSLPRSMRRGPVPSMTPGRAAMVVLMERYLVGLLDPFISLLEVHKLMYFLQEAGEPLRLRFTKGLYTDPMPKIFATFSVQSKATISRALETAATNRTRCWNWYPAPSTMPDEFWISSQRCANASSGLVASWKASKIAFWTGTARHRALDCHP
ncbi:MAG: macro domain-containing protein [Roseiflexus sp.]|nr:macro domain-containing protein [Roseiflexus sp.]MCL6540932.1 macro domain-containing protein [Roseiflexus sp.]